MSQSISKFALVLLALLVVSPGSSPRAQTSQAALQGRVTGRSDGQAIVKALVIERNLQTNTESYSYTNEEGLYAFPALLPGTYAVRVDAHGYQPEERSPVELPVASRVELNFSLNAGETTPLTAGPADHAANISAANILTAMYGSDAAVPQALIVSLPQQVTETLVGSVSSLIDQNKILELPLSGRDVYTLLVLQPGVTSDNATARGLGFSVNGQRVGSSNFLLDGVDNNDLNVTGPATFVSADAVKEYRMTTSNFTAEYGRASAFVANAITRTGTNTFHGTVFEFFNHDRLNANSFTNNWQEVRRPPYRQNQYGASAGGPLKRNRLFFFGNFEQARSSSEAGTRSVILPGPDLIPLLPEGPAKDLLTRFPTPGGEIIPALSSPLFVTRKVVIPAAQHNTFVLGRTDYNSGSGRHRLNVRYAYSDQNTDDFVLSVYPGLKAPLEGRGQNLSANYTRDLFQGANELKFGYSRNTLRLTHPHPELPAIFSLDGILSPFGVVLPGMENSANYAVHDSVFHIVENYSRLSGKHSLVFGFEYRMGLSDTLSSPFGNGQYFFQNAIDFFFNQNPAELLIPVNRLTGLPASENDFRRNYRQGDWAAFLQDNLKLSRRLTLNLGLRYEYFGVPAARKGTVDSNFVFGTGQDITQRIASGGLLPAETLYRRDLNNVAPRFGFAFDVTGSGKNVIRGGYGIFYDRIFNNIWLNVRNNNQPVQCLLEPPLVESEAGCNLPSIQFPFVFTIPPTRGVLPLPPGFVQNTSTAALERHLPTPYTQDWFAGFQRELTPNLVLEVNQVGALSRKLITSDFINRPDGVPRSPSNPHGRFNPNHGEILYYAPQGHANHLAFEAALNRRWSRGMQFQISYTYARTKDVQSDPLVLPGIAAPGNPASRLAASNLGRVPVFTRQFDPTGDYGNSDFDQRHNLVVNFIAQAPRFSSWRTVFGRWQLSGIVGIRSGFPFSVFACPSFIPGERGVCKRADFTGTELSEAFLANPTPIPGGLQLLDPTKFRFPASNQVGNIGRNVFSGPGFWNADLGFSRTFGLQRLPESGQLQLRLEVFNVFNHANLNNPFPTLGTFLGQASFGRQGFASALPSAAPLNDQPRRVQLAMKIYF